MTLHSLLNYICNLYDSLHKSNYHTGCCQSSFIKYLCTYQKLMDFISYKLSASLYLNILLYRNLIQEAKSIHAVKVGNDAK